MAAHSSTPSQPALRFPTPSTLRRLPACDESATCWRAACARRASRYSSRRVPTSSPPTSPLWASRTDSSSAGACRVAAASSRCRAWCCTTTARPDGRRFGSPSVRGTKSWPRRPNGLADYVLTRMVVQPISGSVAAETGASPVTTASASDSSPPATVPAVPGPPAEIYRAPRQDKPWGHEVIFAGVDGKYVGKIIHVSAGHSLSLQYHERKEETSTVLSGAALVEFGPSAQALTSQHLGPG